MKKLKNSKKMLLDAQAFLKTIEKNYSKLNKEYAKNMITLLENIAIGEKLDLDMLKKKYLSTSEQIVSTTIFSNEHKFNNNSSELSSEEITPYEINSVDNSENTELSSEEVILDKIIINNVNYYYENKENGNIYDSNSKIVGEYKNKIHQIFM
jgi:hypothetical protein